MEKGTTGRYSLGAMDLASIELHVYFFSRSLFAEESDKLHSVRTHFGYAQKQLYANMV